MQKLHHPVGGWPHTEMDIWNPVESQMQNGVFCALCVDGWVDHPHYVCLSLPSIAIPIVLLLLLVVTMTSEGGTGLECLLTWE